MTKKTKKDWPKACCLCGKPMENFKASHNAEPLKKGRCCVDCNNLTLAKRIQYDQHGERLVDFVEEMDSDNLDSSLAMTLLLDKAIDLAFYVSGSEAKAREVIETMTMEKAIEYSDKEKN